jgi:hypothetical protein
VPRASSRSAHNEQRTGCAVWATWSRFYVCRVFNLIDRIADAFKFHVPPQAFFARTAPMLLKRGYR